MSIPNRNADPASRRAPDCPKQLGHSGATRFRPKSSCSWGSRCIGPAHAPPVASSRLRDTRFHSMHKCAPIPRHRRFPPHAREITNGVGTCRNHGFGCFPLLPGIFVGHREFVHRVRGVRPRTRRDHEANCRKDGVSHGLDTTRSHLDMQKTGASLHPCVVPDQ
jgi:hypothetical protein